MRHTISLLVEDEYGMLPRVAGLFSARGYSIDTLCVGPTLEDGISRMTMTTHGNDQVIEQIIKQLRKLVKVIKVTDLTERAHVEREMVMVAVTAEVGGHRQEVLNIVNIFRAKVVDVSNDSFILELTGNAEKLQAFIDVLKPMGIKEMVRTGTVAMTRVAATRVHQLKGNEETFSQLTLNEKV